MESCLSVGMVRQSYTNKSWDVIQFSDKYQLIRTTKIIFNHGPRRNKR